MAKATRGLGRGLDSLFQIEQIEAADHSGSVIEIKLEDLRPNPYQPRKVFKQEALIELSQSIEQNGIIQPIIVRESSIKGYEIIAGERRYRAAKLAKLETVPAVVRQFDDQQMMEVALLENLQREDLSPIEEAEAYHNIMTKLNYTQEMIAERMGKSRSHIANYLRLLTLPQELQNQVSEGNISFGHAKVLLGVKDIKLVAKLAKKIVSDGLSVRDLEILVKQQGTVTSKAPKKKPAKKSPHAERYIKEQTAMLREKFGTKAAIHVTEEKGSIEIDFLSLEDLERILEIIFD